MSNITTSEPRAHFDLSPQTFEQALTFSNYLADSDFVPKDFKGKPGNCLIAMQWGAELGLKPLQALQNLAIINGRPSLWGDAVIGLVRSSPLCEYVQESDDGHTATCKVKRRGEPEQVSTFSMDDAKQAGLQGKQGPWAQYPKRMRQMRARAFALRDVFPDVLRGLAVAEEAMDIPAPGERDMGTAERVDQPKKEEPTGFPAERFAKNLPDWRKAIALGKAKPEGIIAKAATIGALSQAQQDAIRAPLTDAEKAAAVPKKAEPDVTDVEPKGEQAAPAEQGQTEGAPITRESLEQRLNAATTIDEVYALGEEVDKLAEPADRAAMNDLFDTRVQHFGG